MTGVWLEGGAIRVRDDLPRPRSRAGEALVRVELAGICNTDLELVRGYYPFRGVLGHEFVGRVEEGADDWVDRRVVGEINCVCSECVQCRKGVANHCARRTVLGIVGRDGAFAEYLLLPTANLHRVPDDLINERAVFAEPLAAALQIREQVPIGADDRVVVVGDGKLGLLVAQALAQSGCQLVAIGRHEAKLEVLVARGIAVGREDDVEDGVFDVAVDCTGNPDGFGLARRALRPRGTLVMKSTYAGDLTVDASSLVVDEITLVGSRCGPFAPALALLAGDEVEVEPLISACYSLADATTAFEHAARRGTLKVLLETEGLH